MSRANDLRRRLQEGTVVAVGAFNALVAKLIERAGFDAVYVSGAALANSAGFPDIGLLTLSEVVWQASFICDAVALPVIVDADTGFGEAVNVERAVREFERVGVAGIHIEDQEFPKRCGHLPGKRVVSVEAMVEKIKAAIAARKEPDFLIIARTDARAVEGFSAAVARAKRYVEAGADAIFPDALESADEFAAFALEVAPAFGIKSKIPFFLANMTEFGKSPYLTISEFASMGYRLVIFPLTAMRVMLKAVEESLRQLKEDGTQRQLLERMMTRQELYELLGYKPSQD